MNTRLPRISQGIQVDSKLVACVCPHNVLVRQLPCHLACKHLTQAAINVYLDLLVVQTETDIKEWV